MMYSMVVSISYFESRIALNYDIFISRADP